MTGRWLAALCAASVAIPAQAQVARMELDSILRGLEPARVATRRSACAMGQAPLLIATSRDAGLETATVGAWCVTVLTRTGRDGKLGYVRDPRSARMTAAIAFDNGFVGGYLKREILPAGAPAMTTLLPIADRCLDQKEVNTNLCNAVGQMLGARAARGEVVSLR